MMLIIVIQQSKHWSCDLLCGFSRDGNMGFSQQTSFHPCSKSAIKILWSNSPAAWEVRVNPPAWLSGKTMLCFGRKTAPRTHHPAAAEL